MFIQQEIRALNTATLKTMTRECLAWRSSGTIPEDSIFAQFVESVDDENFRGDMRAIDSFIIVEAARRFSQVDNVTITQALAGEAAQALSDARRYGAGDWTDLEDQLNAISQ